MSKKSLFDEFFSQDADTSDEESTDVLAEEILGDAPFHPQNKPTYVPRDFGGFYGGVRGGSQGFGGFCRGDRIGYRG